MNNQGFLFYLVLGFVFIYVIPYIDEYTDNIKHIDVSGQGKFPIKIMWGLIKSIRYISIELIQKFRKIILEKSFNVFIKLIISGLAIVDDILITSAEAFDDICVAGAEFVIPPFLGMIYSSIIAAISVIFDGIEIILRLTMRYADVFLSLIVAVLLYGIFTGHLLFPIMKCTASISGFLLLLSIIYGLLVQGMVFSSSFIVVREITRVRNALAVIAICGFLFAIYYTTTTIVPELFDFFIKWCSFDNDSQ